MKDVVCEFECNIDDMTAEELAFASEQIMAGGAKDVAFTALGMKKGRPGTLLTVMCAEDEEVKAKIIGLIFKYTTTIGIREVISARYILDRAEDVIHTPYGDVRLKTVSGYGVTRSKLEYEDLAAIARDKGISLAEARRLVMGYTETEDIEG